MTMTAKEPRPAGLLSRVTCPHCWEQCAPEKLLWVSEHTDLLGDHRLGPEQAQRFLPTRFSLNGEAIDANAVAKQSQLARQVLLQTSPETVTAAEGFAEDVTYVPVTAVGWNVAVDAKSGLPAIKPSEAAPYWATVPFLYGLSRAVPGLIPTISKRKNE